MPKAQHLRRLTRAFALVLAAVAVDASLAAAATAAPPAAPPVDPGQIGVRLVDAPSTARDDPRAQIYIVDHLAPGAAIRRRIEITNTSSSAMDVRLYSAGAAITAGSFLGHAGTIPNDLSTWTSVTPGELRVPAKGRVMATVRVALPRDAAPGEQYGVVWAEVRSAAADGSVVQVSRVGIRLYLSVGPGGPPPADFTIESLTATRTAEGRPAVVATVHNTGGRALDLSGSMALADGPGGLSAGPFPAKLGTTLAVGATEPVTIPLDVQIPNGPWDAKITLRSGLVERAAEATITFPVAGVAPAVRATPVRPWWLYPAIGLAVLLLCALVLYLALRRRRHARDERFAGLPLAASERLADVAPKPIPTPATIAPVPVPGLEPAPVLEPALSPEPVPVLEPILLPFPERRRAIPERKPRLDLQPVTASDIADAPYHWQLALPGSQDALTELANRSLFMDETQFVMDAGGADNLCLMLLNLNDFTTVNDTFGRAGGDTALIATAERLRRVTRPYDLVARLDGDDFGILFENVAHADVNTIAERMLGAMREPFDIGGHEVRIEASIGVAPSRPADDARLLLGRAAEALTQAKAANEMHYAWYAAPARHGEAGPA